MVGDQQPPPHGISCLVPCSCQSLCPSIVSSSLRSPAHNLSPHLCDSCRHLTHLNLLPGLGRAFSWFLPAARPSLILLVVNLAAYRSLLRFLHFKGGAGLECVVHLCLHMAPCPHRPEEMRHPAPSATSQVGFQDVLARVGNLASRMLPRMDH